MSCRCQSCSACEEKWERCKVFLSAACEGGKSDLCQGLQQLVDKWPAVLSALHAVPTPTRAKATQTEPQEVRWEPFLLSLHTRQLRWEAFCSWRRLLEESGKLEAVLRRQLRQRRGSLLRQSFQVWRQPKRPQEAAELLEETFLAWKICAEAARAEDVSEEPSEGEPVMEEPDAPDLSSAWGMVQEELCRAVCDLQQALKRQEVAEEQCSRAEGQIRSLEQDLAAAKTQLREAELRECEHFRYESLRRGRDSPEEACQQVGRAASQRLPLRRSQNTVSLPSLPTMRPGLPLEERPKKFCAASVTKEKAGWWEGFSKLQGIEHAENWHKPSRLDDGVSLRLPAGLPTPPAAPPFRAEALWRIGRLWTGLSARAVRRVVSLEPGEAGAVTPRVFEARQRLFGAERPQLKFWHDAAGWCPHCMVSWVVMEEMEIPYVMDTTPLRAYLKPGEKKRQKLVPVIQLIEEHSKDGQWHFQEAMKGVGRGEQVCQMLQQRFPDRLPRPENGHWQLFKALQVAHSAYKRLKGRPTWGVAGNRPEHQEQLMSALDDLEAALAASAKRSDADAAAAKSCFLNGSKPNMMDLMLLPMLERVEALLLHPFLQVSGLELRNWPRVWAMLAEGRRPGVCSFGHLCSDAETLLAISLREDPGRTSALSLEGTILQPEASLMEAAHAAQHPPEATREAAARICANAKAVVSFACCGRGCGRAAAAAPAKGAAATADAALRWVVAALLRPMDAVDLEVSARRAVEALSSEDSEAMAVPLRFLAQNVGVPRDMGAEPAAALRAHLRLLVAALEKRKPGKGIGRPRAERSGQDAAGAGRSFGRARKASPARGRKTEDGQRPNRSWIASRCPRIFMRKPLVRCVPG
ncbi:unnamed protein product [Effrenium voratum]|nr:unnamed protein product [Effrenium voratum]